MSKAAIVLGVVGVVLAVVAIAGPWWTFTESATFMGVTVSGTANFGLFNAYMAMPGSAANTTSYASAGLTNTGNVFTMGMVLLVVGLILGLLMVILVAMSGNKPGLRKIGAVMGILGFILMLVAPIYVMATLPGAMSADGGGGLAALGVTGWSGSSTINLGGISATVSWGGGWGWYMPIIGAVILLIGAILAFRAPKPAVAPMPPPMEMPQAQMPPPPP